MRLAAGLRPDPLGELERSPRHPSRNWKVPTSKGGKGRKGEKGRKEWEGRKGRVGEGGKGKDDLHPTLFLGPETSSFHGCRFFCSVSSHTFATSPSSLL